MLQLRNKEYNGFAETTISLGIKTVVNLTLDYNQLRVSGEPALPNQVAIFPYGLMVSAEDEIFVYAVKSDQGTTDGYLVSVLTNYSKEFFIAGWP
jgi:hypothetical protein